MKKLRPVVFLDRDGTLIDERGYLSDPAKIYFYPSVFAALRRLQKAGFRLVILTNQSGVARGYFTLKRLQQINQRFTKLLAAKGVRIDGIYFCPHFPTAGCSCRKPQIGLALRAAKELSLDLKRAYMVGDQLGDMNMARQLNIPGVMVLTGAGRSLRVQAGTLPTKITSNIATAVKWVLSSSQFK